MLITVPEVAVILTVPATKVDAKPVESIVTSVVLLDFHVAMSVISNVPLQVFAIAMYCIPVPALTLLVVGVTAIDVIQPTVTVRVVDPAMAAFWVEVAVMVAVPRLTAVASPVADMVATDVGVLVQLTAGLPVLPSLNVPEAVICTVLPVVPV